jgi:uncharacterized protein YndB with AHSA1/START domain
MLTIILLVLAVVIVVFVIVATLQPAGFRIVRSATITAPPAVVFAQVNDLHAFQLWSPWAKLDPAMKSTFAGPPAGRDAVYAWVGNAKVGEGRMTITESKPADRVQMKLEFLKPFKATNTTEFVFRAEGSMTAVTWSMSGTNGFMFKAVSLFMNMDKMVGKDFENGLANLKSVAEAAAK